MAIRRRGNDNITFNGMPTGYHLKDFWEWGFSDLLNNTLRGAYCEFIVATALGLDLSSCRTDWTAWDLTYPIQLLDGSEENTDIRLEVKSGAYLQSWNCGKLSNIVLSIRPTLSWDAIAGYSDSAIRHSDVYVFGLYAETDPAKADPAVLDGWRFYVVSTSFLNERFGDQKTLSLPSLLNICPNSTDYYGLKDAVLSCVRGG